MLSAVLVTLAIPPSSVLCTTLHPESPNHPDASLANVPLVTIFVPPGPIVVVSVLHK